MNKDLLQSPQVLPDILVALDVRKSPNDSVGKLNSPIMIYDSLIQGFQSIYEDIPEHDAKLPTTQGQRRFTG